MGTVVPRGRSDLFLVRLWADVRPDGSIEWRGRIQRVADGNPHPFDSLSELVDVLRLLLSKAESRRTQ